MVQRGFVVSDLHLFSDRSTGEQLLKNFLQTTTRLDLFVFNGDTFDFAWTNRQSINQAIDHAIMFLERIVISAPTCQFIYVLGNHDCRPDFVGRLRVLMHGYTNFSYFEDTVRLGQNLFLHGDVCNYKMDRQGLIKQRKRDAATKVRSTFAHMIYQYIIFLRLNRIVYLTHSRQEMIKRLYYYLERCNPAIMEGVSRVFFGHTHAPFRFRDARGIEFVNTGSGIRGLRAAFSEFTVE